MYFGKESALKEHLKHNIPENLWYFTTNNGVTRAAPARAVELFINPIRKRLEPGNDLKHYKIFMDDFSPTLNFSDRTDLMVHELGRPVRTQDGISGNMREFILFRMAFPTTRGHTFWVPTADVFQKARGPAYGEIANEGCFPRILEQAHKLIAWTNEQLK